MEIECAMRKPSLARDMVDALDEITSTCGGFYDKEKIDELARKLILPLSRLKFCGKEFVLENGLPTITAEIANDTDWLK